MSLVKKLVLGMMGGRGAATPVSSLLTGLVSYWKMDEASDGSGNVTRIDTMGAHNFTSNNTVASGVGVIGNGASLVAANSEYLSIADHADFKAVSGVPFEFALWINQASAAYAMLLTKYTAISTSEYYLQLYADGRVVWDIYGGAGHSIDSQAAKVAGTFSAGSWHIVFCGMDTNNKAFLQVDNGPVTIAAISVTETFAAAGLLKIGSRNAADYFSGVVDEVAYWRGRTLTPTERTTLFNGGSGITHPFDDAATSGFQVNSASAARAISPLTTPTYDGSGQVVHVDVYDAGNGNTWNGHRYWMANTPYPNETEVLENPSILISDDGTTWTVPEGLTNPVVPANADTNVINSDVDLLMDDGILWMTYRTYNRLTGAEVIYICSSSDGITWSAPTEILSSAAQVAICSPALIKVGTTYYMYSVDCTGHPGRDIIYFVNRRSASSPVGPWSAATLVSFPIYTWIQSYPVRPTKPWHIDVQYSDGEYFAILLTWDYNIIIGHSTDGINFKTSVNPIIAPITGLWDSYPYRGSIVRNASGFDYWYPAFDISGSPKVYRVGRTTISVPFTA